MLWAWGGRCAICHIPLLPGWHADHKQPWSKGGTTTPANGQPLCRRCNVRKSNNIVMRQLREWQTNAFQEWKRISKTKKDFLLCAAVGAGKTLEACVIGEDFIQEFLHLGGKRKIIIVTNSLNLVSNWASEAAKVGIQLKEPDNTALAAGLPADVQGYVTTYHSMGAYSELHGAICSRYDALVIFDEVHHLEEGIEGEVAGSVWCRAAKTAFDGAVFRLLLSGTPFRSSGKRIPFITYKELEPPSIPATFEIVADFKYSYGQAVADKVCRPVRFHKFGCGDIGRIEYKLDGTDYSWTFEDLVNDTHKSESLRAFNDPSLEPENFLLAKMLEAANEQLAELRDNGDPDAGGLVIAQSKAHAERLREFFFQKTGIKGEIVTSDDEGAQVKLRRFKEGTKEWLFAVRMVSEGVDIPRLRVMVYCPQITGELFFLQAMGRIVRQGDRQLGWAHMFMPADPRFIDYAAKVEDEIRIVLERTGRAEEEIRGSFMTR